MTATAKLQKILVVDDDDAVRAALEKMLSQKGFDVVVAGGGAAAREIVDARKDLAAVISDIRMPGIDGLELTAHIKSNSRIPVILMTGFSDIAETQDAYTLGADGFLPKPFRMNEILELLHDCLRKGAPADGLADEDRFRKLSIDDFISGSSIQYDIYIQLSDRRFVKIAHCGEDLSLDRIRQYKSKDVRFLLLRHEDFLRYVGFNVAVIRAAKGSATVNSAKRLALLKHTGELILEQLRFHGMDEDAYRNAKLFVETAAAVITQETDILDLLAMLEVHTDHLYVHSVGVAFISVAIARQLGWTSGSTLFKVGLGGFLHDVGKKEIDRAILDRKRTLLSPEDVKALETHPGRGAGILSTVSGIPEEVVMIAAQHHERCMGHGFPSGLRKDRIFPLARLVSVANQFCNLVLPGPDREEPLSPGTAIYKLRTLYADSLDPAFVDALEKVFRRPAFPEASPE